MKTIEFQDHNGNQIKVQMSSLATQDAFRVFITNIDGKDIGDLHLTKRQANILINALQDLMEDLE